MADLKLKLARLAVGVVLLIPFMIVGEQVDLLPLIDKAADWLRKAHP